MKHSIFGLAGVALGVVFGVASCLSEPSGSAVDLAMAGSGGQLVNAGGSTAQTDAGANAGGEGPACVPRVPVGAVQCHPAQSTDPLGGRAVSGKPQPRTVYASQVFAAMNTYCGACHVEGSLGNFHFTSGSFASVVDQKVLSAIQSNTDACAKDANGNKTDPTCFDFMPPAPLGKKWSDREADPSDPLKPLVVLLTAWLAQGQADPFTVAPQPGDKAPYTVTQTLANAFTNIGTCVPDAGLVGIDPAGCDMDARFAALEAKPTGGPVDQIGLPATLDQTDLTTFDYSVLAQKGVVGYAPAYPLWTDDAGKMRMVRVPYGQSITYNKKTKQFDIPANTRFYKTFLKKVKGVDGVVRYRKIETRLIVSRPRDADGNDKALFGTYEWTDDESQANLLTDPQNNGVPFVDKIKPITIDEQAAAEVTALFKKGKVYDISYELDNRHALRRYAFPSSARCMQCHMGSPSSSFILGFTPLQLNTRPCDAATIAKNGHCEAGQYEPSGGDELTQVDRLTSYGVLSGYGPSELQNLENDQGTSKAPRKVRTEQELAAQAYMLGNCSHCHNPNGYPSVIHPELEPLLNFLPSEVGGIFEFPFERYSPRIFRNAAGDGPIAYISPSLRDRYGSLTAGWVPKIERVLAAGSTSITGGVDTFIDAPWRSLIYRNVDTPFTYVDDSAIYPHMPLNSPGFDCRVPRIMGEWMTSIPAVPKNPNLSEDVARGATPDEFTTVDPQPYREVKQGDADYANGVVQARGRLTQFRSGLRDNNYCPDTSDIVDLNVLRSNNTILIPSDNEVASLPVEGVPDRPHWVSVDLTDPPGAWTPRRPDWQAIIVNQDFSGITVPTMPDQVLALYAQKSVVSILQGVHFSSAADDPFYKFATTPFNFAVWQPKPTCNLDSQPKASTLLAQTPHARWLDLDPDVQSVPDARVFSSIPGALVFNMICVNCHGPDADSGGRQAQTLAEMTGGIGRVANFKDGFFGPVGATGANYAANRKAIFGTDEIAARYLPWMALGGTNVKIPVPILNLVANTPVAGVPRTGITVRTANMLQTAQALCAQVGQLSLPVVGMMDFSSSISRAGLHGQFGLINQNGDAELWEKLCMFNNPPPVNVLNVAKGGDSGYELVHFVADLYFSANYPANTPIGDGFGNSQPSLTADNTLPWCVYAADQASDPALSAWLAKQATLNGKPYPICPDGFAAPDKSGNFVNRFALTDATTGLGDIDKWAARGAINAGQAVFVYLDQMISQGKGRSPRYDECDLTSTTTTTSQ